jgi:chromosome partitioning protein
MRQIAIINQKGGVGKTTSCCNLGAALAACGKSVLLIDLDPQANLTMHLGIEPDADKPSVYNVLTDHTPIMDAAVECGPNLFLVPSHIDLAAAEMELVSVLGREVILRDALRDLPRPFDYVMIDCPPSLGVLTINGLVAMDEVLVPMQPHFLALQGVGKLLETIALVKNRINPRLSVAGIILCMYDAGTRLAGEVTGDLNAFLTASRDSDVPWKNARVFSTIIRRNIKLAECPSHGRSIFDYAPTSNGAADYAQLTEEVFAMNVAALTASKPAPARPVRTPAGATEASPAKPVPVAQPEVAAQDLPSDAVAPVALEESVAAEVAAPEINEPDYSAFGPDDVGIPASEPVAAQITTHHEHEAWEPAMEVEVRNSNEPVAPLPPPPVRADPPLRLTIPIAFEDEHASVVAPSEGGHG